MSKRNGNFHITPAALTVTEAADYLRISAASIWRLLEQGALQRTRIGGRTVIRRADLDGFLDRCTEASR